MSEIADPDRNLVVIQRNPVSGTGQTGRHLKRLIAELRELDYQVRLFASRQRLDDFVAEPGQRDRLRCLVAAGGDGTLSSLVNRHPSLPIATLPLGTENLVARFLNIPRCGVTVARLVHDNCQHVFDTGLAGNHRFLIMVSAGIDAAVVRRMNAIRGGNIHRLSYVAPIWRCFMTYTFPEILVTSADGQHSAKGTHVIAANMPQYGFGLKFATDADPSDGMLDIRVFQGTNRVQSALHGLKLRFSAHGGSHVVSFRSRSIRLTSPANGVAAQCDGDPIPPLPAEIQVDPGSMRLIVRRPDRA
ncbi:MAG: diacylglycerol kinase family protein [Planctomycetaceae bacterium]